MHCDLTIPSQWLQCPFYLLSVSAKFFYVSLVSVQRRTKHHVEKRETGETPCVMSCLETQQTFWRQFHVNLTLVWQDDLTSIWVAEMKVFLKSFSWLKSFRRLVDDINLFLFMLSHNITTSTEHVQILAVFIQLKHSTYFLRFYMPWCYFIMLNSLIQVTTWCNVIWACSSRRRSRKYLLRT